MGERVLVTGGAGFVGLHLVRHLLRAGAAVTVMDDFSRGVADDEFRAVTPDIEIIEHDLTMPVPGHVARGHFDAAYHLAGLVGVGRVMRYPGQVLRTNILSTMHFLAWCARSDPQRIFLSSTSEVADGAAALGLASFPVAEDAPFAIASPGAPRASYAISKLVAEALLLHETRQCGIRIGRYHNVYGPRMGSAHVIPQFIERVLLGVDPFPVYGAYQSRAFCYIEDAVEATCRLMAVTAPEPIVANIGNDQEEVRIVDLAHRLFAVAGVCPRLELHEPPAQSPDRRLPDVTRLRALTGFTPRHDLQNGLSRTFSWYAGAAQRSPA